MKKLILILLGLWAVFVFAACQNEVAESPQLEIQQAEEEVETAVPPTTSDLTLDETTGLPLNPAEFANIEEFIVQGEIIDVSLIPQDNPSFRIKSEAGDIYLVAPQHLADIAMADGTAIAPHEFKVGMVARATVHDEGELAGLAQDPALTSNDLVILPNADTVNEVIDATDGEEATVTKPEDNAEANVDQTATSETKMAIDEATGLPINPVEFADLEEFIVEGEITDLVLAPLDSASFRVKSEAGILYLIAPQHLSEVFMTDGTPIAPHEFKIGMMARATVRDEGELAGLAQNPALTSDDFTILISNNE